MTMQPGGPSAHLSNVDTQALSLIEAARAGDRVAYETLLRPLIGPAFGLAFTMLHSRDEAEDAVQEAALRAWSRVRQVRPGSRSLRPWFLAVVANQCRMMLRARWWSVIRMAEPSRSAVPSGEDGWVRHLDLERAFRALRPRERQLIFLHFGLDLPLEEVAQVAGLSRAATKARLYRSLARLRPQLKAEEIPT